MASGNLWDYYKDEIDKVDVNDNASDGKSFDYKIKIVGETPGRHRHNLEIQEMHTDQHNHQYCP